MTHMHLLLTYFHMCWRLSVFVGYIHEIHGEYDQKAQLRKRKAEMRNGIKGQNPPTHQTWAEH